MKNLSKSNAISNRLALSLIFLDITRGFSQHRAVEHVNLNSTTWSSNGFDKKKGFGDHLRIEEKI